MVDSCIENHRNSKSKRFEWRGLEITHSGNLSDLKAGTVLRTGLSDTTKPSKGTIQSNSLVVLLGKFLNVIL